MQNDLNNLLTAVYGTGTTIRDGQIRPVSSRNFLRPKSAKDARFYWRDDRAEYDTRKGNKPSRSLTVVESRHHPTKMAGQATKSERYAMATTAAVGRAVAPARLPRRLLEPEEHLRFEHRLPTAFETRLAELARSDATAFLECLAAVSHAVPLDDADEPTLDLHQSLQFIFSALAESAQSGTLDQLHDHLAQFAREGVLHA